MPLVPAFIECGGANTANDTHGAPLAFPSCNPPAAVGTQLTIGTPDANGAAAKSSGFLRLDVIFGDPATPESESDVRIRAHEQDIRTHLPGLTDYTGELEAAVTLRITDKDGSNATGNGPASATSADFPLHLAIQCTATADTTIGSSCDLDTTANAVTPGSVVERRRTIWELGEVQVLDGGPDGLASTEGNNQLFLVQGLFVP
jgi:hypothetical protein